MLKVYKDTLDYDTIGYGHLLEEHEKGKLKLITKEKA
jgi:hypothetical protein